MPFPLLMRRGSTASLFSLMIILMSLSGCISEGGDSTDATDEDMPVFEDFQGLDYVECMTHEDLERCWNVLVPVTIDLSQEVPLVIDLHGNTLTMQMQRDLSQFDDIAEENSCLLYTSPSPRDQRGSRMPSSA